MDHQWVHIQSIKLVDNHPLNPKTMELAVKLWNKEIFPDDLPPIRLYQTPEGINQIKDGRHRYIAFRLCGLTHIKATISKPKHIK
jgi:hypothetical protein